jgi:putative oxidoreductase
MKHAPNIAGLLLGLAFVVFGLNFFIPFLPASAPPPPQSAAGAFANILFATGYLAFVKVLEVLGGVLVALPKTRNFGLLILGPIIINILCYNTFLTKGEGLLAGPVIPIAALALYLLWTERNAFAALLNREPGAPIDQSSAGDNPGTMEEVP